MNQFAELSIFTKTAVIIGVLAFISFLFFIINLMKMANNKKMSKMMRKSIKMSKEIIDENKDDLKYISEKNAQINSKGTEITARAIKKGFIDDKGANTVFCKHCGKEIEADSKYCKYCGREQ